MEWIKKRIVRDHEELPWVEIHPISKTLSEHKPLKLINPAELMNLLRTREITEEPGEEEQKPVTNYPFLKIYPEYPVNESAEEDPGNETTEALPSYEPEIRQQETSNPSPEPSFVNDRLEYKFYEKPKPKENAHYSLGNSTLNLPTDGQIPDTQKPDFSDIEEIFEEEVEETEALEHYSMDCPEEESRLLEPVRESTPIKTQTYEKETPDYDPHQRSSITPEVKVNRQISIPFHILETSQKNQAPMDTQEDAKIIEILESTLEEFGIEARVIGIQRGPIITRYELKIPAGIKVNRILSLSDELAMALEAIRVRIEAPIPGRSTVGIEIPNKSRHTVLLGDILNTPDFQNYHGNLPLPMGKDIAGKLLIEDLCKMPHLLIAGATGSGKSVAVNSFITSFILNKTPEQIRLLLVDPKLVELSHYNDIPHLLHPVIVDPQKAVAALNWAVEEMERRYEDMAEMRARDISSFNEKVEEYNRNEKHKDAHMSRMPYIVVLIDELGDLMMVAGKEVESSIIRLSQKARAVGIHLILATQRPSVDVITALIKANCPARIALQVAQKTDSRTILDSNGGEQLLGQGDMLFKHPSKAQLIRAQAPLVKDHEVEEVVERIKKSGKPSYITLEDPKANLTELETEDEQLFDEAWNIIVESKKASASYLQRRLRIGYNRAARLIEAFEARGYIGPQVGSKPREILMPDHS